MNAIGLKYTGTREEGIRVMLFKSYKTASITKRNPYRFTDRDRVTPDAINYYYKLAKLGVVVITDEADFQTSSFAKIEVRTEPLAAETDVQIDPTASPATAEDAMSAVESSEQMNASETPEHIETSDEVVPTGAAAEVISTDSGNELVVDKDVIKAMNESELSEYIEMNLSRDQIKTMISELNLDITVGRKGASTLVGEIVSATTAEVLVNYLCK